MVPKYGSLSLRLNDCHYRDDERSMGSKKIIPAELASIDVQATSFDYGAEAESSMWTDANWRTHTCQRKDHFAPMIA